MDVIIITKRKQYPQGNENIKEFRTFQGKKFEYARTFDSNDKDQIDVYKSMMKKLGYKVRTVWDSLYIHVYTRMG